MSVYYFSFMKLIVSIFLVYKVKKCLLKSGKVNKRFIRMCPRLGETMPKAWGEDAQRVGRQCPSRGEHFLMWFNDFS